MEERLRFFARLLESESMSDVCRAFGISRKTGYKPFNRYKEFGAAALGLHDQVLNLKRQLVGIAHRPPGAVGQRTIDNPFGTRLSPISPE
jgi:hypothetical protein